MTDTRRPAWRRFASRVRFHAYRLASRLEPLWHRIDGGILPPLHLRMYYYGTGHPDVFARQCANARLELTSRGLKPTDRLLDIGSGIGNLAIALAPDSLACGYDGLEINPEAVAWCQSAITPRYPHLRFHRADVASEAYNPAGRVSAATLRFPFPDGSFDFIYLGSVFTHMMPADVQRYVDEIARVLVPSGVCIASYFLLNQDTSPLVAARQSFKSFDVIHDSGLARLHDESVPEAAVAIDEGFVRGIHELAGLVVHDIRRGKWPMGTANDQDVLTVFRRANFVRRGQSNQ